MAKTTLYQLFRGKIYKQPNEIITNHRKKQKLVHYSSKFELFLVK